jgi:hypothetical protein
VNNNLDKLLAKIKHEADAMDRIYARRDDLRYRSIQALVLDYGKPFINRIIPSPFRAEVALCYQNCFERLLLHDDYHYCEGYAIDDDLNLVIAHAWLISDTGEVIDPTWTENITGETYFGVVFDGEYVLKMGEKNERYGILDNDYMNVRKLMMEGLPLNALHSKFYVGSER